MKHTYIPVEEDKRLNRFLQGCIVCHGFGPFTVQAGHYEADSTLVVDDELGACAYHKEELEEWMAEQHDYDFTRSVS